MKNNLDFLYAVVLPAVLLILIVLGAIYIFYLLYIRMPKKDRLVKEYVEEVRQNYGDINDIRRINATMDKYKYKKKLNFVHLPDTASSKEVALAKFVCGELEVIDRHLNRMGFVADMHRSLLNRKIKNGLFDPRERHYFSIKELNEIDRQIGLIDDD